jgi:membrane-associated phospholipid phosphatase
VLLGVHYPSEVIAGVALGLAWVGAAALHHPTRRPAPHASSATLLRLTARTVTATSQNPQAPAGTRELSGPRFERR